MKKFLITCLFSITLLTAFSAHIKGGFFTYEYLGPGTVNTSFLKYKITLTVYMGCFPSAGQLNSFVNFTIFQGNTNVVHANPQVNLTRRYELEKTADEPCIALDQRGCYYTVVIYELANIELPVTANGYTISYQRCCRIAGMDNVVNSGSVGNTYSIRIPGTSSPVPNAIRNSSPNFPVNDTAIVCGGSFFSYPFSAVDTDPQDVLTYSLCAAFEGGTTADPSPGTASSPPYQTLNYTGAYNGAQPMGPNVTINPNTGLISGIAPVPSSFGGEFVVTVCVTETRNGVVVGESRKELHIQVKDCDPVAARLAPKGVTCDGFTVNFSNASVNPQGTTHDWEFGDPGSGVNNRSSLSNPVHVYSDTGVYKVKLTVSIGGLCSSTDSLIVRVYPGFFPDLSTIGPLCKGVPVNFIDNTTLSYGTTNGWRWDFGNLLVTSDTSRLKNPTYVFSDTGTFNVQLIVGSSLGCIDTITKPITIYGTPAIDLLTPDTLICSIDTLQLQIANTGNFVWSPNYNINNVNSANPLVSPDIPTKYFVSYTDGFGCTNRDSVFVDVKLFVTIDAGNDTTICRTDGLTLTTTSDALQYRWSPALYLDNPTAKRPFAIPLGAVTTYKVIGNIGKCSDSAEVTITTLPYPLANAGTDTTLCFGFSTQLAATGGISYQWTPGTYLSAINIPNPLVTRPATTTRYIVAVSDTVGCLKPAYDTVFVNVDPVVNANAGPADTTAVLGEPLQLTATGGVSYSWQPSTWLSNTGVANPVSNPQDDITYRVLVTSAAGCQATDTIRVKLFRVPPSFYVPSGFTPNNDGRNDLLKPILLGMRTLDYFRVYNRFGNLIFTTSQKGRGWDGTFKGVAQGPGTYIWMASGTTFTGEAIVKKGSVVLLR